MEPGQAPRRWRAKGWSTDVRRVGRATGILGVLGVLCLAGACSRSEQAVPASAPTPAARPFNGAIAPLSAAPADDGQWAMAAKNYASTRFSELNEINAGNVAGLQVA